MDGAPRCPKLPHLVRSFAAIALFCLLASAPVAMARDVSPSYVTPEAVNLSAVLPPPPEPASPEAKADMDAVLALQAGRTSESVALAQKDRKQTVFRFADVLGPDFRRKRLPLTAAFFAEITADEEAILATVKNRWQRPRPFVANPAVTTCVKRPTTGSYPSSHAALGYLYGLILADMLPRDRDALLARAQTYAESRALCGVHYPSDIAAGKRAAEAIFAALKASPRYQAVFPAVREEIQAALNLQTAH
ncbi:acid phosphatase [Chelatococcus asaccharovorans]|uniref:acid phosphatase n=1 Tax=Chelatococcus asaccharovorans TaxID=28210 RepID=UPI00224C6C52|nr:phosphatase PAP2 family protein [Chelatococcus asaccharovorans]CAH1666225.1 Acid phosphatase [Chelatococcus asaccharovorans]CAH1681581.1 Acid phosphatase [Chelatococcus asaccharovorans]